MMADSEMVDLEMSGRHQDPICAIHSALGDHPEASHCHWIEFYIVWSTSQMYKELQTFIHYLLSMIKLIAVLMKTTRGAIANVSSPVPR